MNAVTFTVPGTPVGKGRPKFARRGQYVQTYTPAKTANYENLIKWAAHDAMAGRALIEGPVDLFIVLWLTPPASWSKRKKNMAMAGLLRPVTKPDIDNVLKAICDAMNKVVWNDDSQVVRVAVTKHYGEIAQAQVEVNEVGGNE